MTNLVSFLVFGFALAVVGAIVVFFGIPLLAALYAVASAFV